jgi:hypothetical protein
VAIQQKDSTINELSEEVKSLKNNLQAQVKSDSKKSEPSKGANNVQQRLDKLFNANFDQAFEEADLVSFIFYFLFIR